MSDPRWPSVVLDPHMIVEETIRDWLVFHDFGNALPEEVKRESKMILWGLSRAIPTQVSRRCRPDEIWNCRAVLAFDGRFLTWRVTGEDKDTDEEWMGGSDILALIEDCAC